MLPEGVHVTQSRTRALENQIVGSILTQIDTGIEKVVNFVPTDYFNRCKDLVFGRRSTEAVKLSQPANWPCFNQENKSLSFSRKLDRILDMSNGKKDQGANAQIEDGTEADAEGAFGGDIAPQASDLNKLLRNADAENQLMSECMREVRNMRGEAVGLGKRVPKAETSIHSKSAPRNPTSSSTPQSGHVNERREPNQDVGAEVGRRRLAQVGNGNNPRQEVDGVRTGVNSFSLYERRKNVDLDRWHVKFDGSSPGHDR